MGWPMNVRGRRTTTGEQHEQKVFLTYEGQNANTYTMGKRTCLRFSTFRNRLTRGWSKKTCTWVIDDNHKISLLNQLK